MSTAKNSRRIFLKSVAAGVSVAGESLTAHAAMPDVLPSERESVQHNKAALWLLIQDAMPKGQLEVVRGLVSPECVNRRAGFANLYAARNDAIPEKGNFIQWLEAGWKPLSEALGDQHVVVNDLAGEGNTAWAHYRMEVKHRGTFVGVPATGKTVEWEEIAIAHFGPDGKIVDLWFMCEEVKLATQLGLRLI